MTEELDPDLAVLFREVERLEDEAFLAAVSRDVQRAGRRRQVFLGLLGVLGFGLLWLIYLPLSSTVTLMTQLLTMPLFELGEGFISLILSPINNSAGILIILGKVTWSYWKRILRSAYG